MLMIGIRQFFTRQNFPNPDSSKFSTVKILHHTVAKSLLGLSLMCQHNFETDGWQLLELQDNYEHNTRIISEEL